MAVKAPAGLGPRGRRMWRETTTETVLNSSHRVLLEEACRIADRLDALDAAIGAGAVEDEETQKLLAESRQQSTVLRGLLTEIRQGQRAKEPVKPSVKAGGGVADITARIAKRRGEAPG